LRKNLSQPTIRPRRETLGKLAGQVRRMTLQHGGLGPVKFILKGRNNSRAIVTRVVNAVPPKESRVTSGHPK
jgi:hypothetical protein